MLQERRRRYTGDWSFGESQPDVAPKRHARLAARRRSNAKLREITRRF